MNKTTEETKTILECCENGKRVVRPFHDAHRQFWLSNYAWLIPSDWYRWEIDRYSGETYVYPVVKKAALRLGFLIHTRKEPLTMDDLEEADGDGYELSVDAFVARAYRFNRLFGNLPRELRPYHYMDVLNKMGIPRPAYRMNPQRTYLVVLGIAPESPRTDVDWSLFCQPPKDFKASVSRRSQKSK